MSAYEAACKNPTIQNVWESYLNLAYNGKPPAEGSAQYLEVQRGFYAGAHGLYTIIASVADASPEVQGNVMESVVQDILTFARAQAAMAHSTSENTKVPN